ncbi:MAG: hypothetical protein LBR51_07070 [Bacteroidales bacterium]|jgi:hypothetical protein|nr:hypothetical protein [Bacteroidales bacterium]
MERCVKVYKKEIYRGREWWARLWNYFQCFVLCYNYIIRAFAALQISRSIIPYPVHIHYREDIVSAWIGNNKHFAYVFFLHEFG